MGWLGETLALEARSKHGRGQLPLNGRVFEMPAHQINRAVKAIFNTSPEEAGQSLLKNSVGKYAPVFAPQVASSTAMALILIKDVCLFATLHLFI
ncbi:MAG: hypothetical protein WA996_24345 [Candidatus Promineifilaceae bacterium]